MQKLTRKFHQISEHCSPNSFETEHYRDLSTFCARRGNLKCCVMLYATFQIAATCSRPRRCDTLSVLRRSQTVVLMSDVLCMCASCGQLVDETYESTKMSCYITLHGVSTSRTGSCPLLVSMHLLQ